MEQTDNFFLCNRLEGGQESVNSFHLQKTADHRMAHHSLHKLMLSELVIIIPVPRLEHLCHHGGQVHGTTVSPYFNEESHHVEEFFNIYGAVTILVKKVEHLAEVVFSFTITEEIEEQSNGVNRGLSIRLFHICNFRCQHVELVFRTFWEGKTEDLLELLLFHLSIAAFLHEFIIII